MAFSLRPTTESDRTYLTRLFYLTDVYGDETREVSDDFPDSLSLYVDAWDAGQGGLVALSDKGVPAGGVWLRAGSSARPRYGWVSDEIPELAIAVEGAYRRQGLAAQLLRAIVDYARAEGCPGVSLSVDTVNEGARRVYERFGFVSHEVHDDEGFEIMVYYF